MKPDDLLFSPISPNLDKRHVRFNQEGKKSESIVQKTPYRRVAQQMSTPIRVGREIIDLFSPESPLVTPVRAEKRDRLQENSLSAAVRIQSEARRLMGMHNLTMIHGEAQRRAAAIQIQLCARRYNAATRQRKAQVWASIQIQSIIRRRIASNLVTSMIHKQQEQVQAANRIQSYVRRFFVTSSIHKIRTAAIVIQKTWRASLCRLHYALSIQAVKVLQAAFQAFLQKRTAKRLRHEAVVLVQSSIRRNLALNEFKRIHAEKLRAK